MKIKWKSLLVCVAIPVAVYFVIGFLSADSAEVFNAFVKPPLSPPSWLFPIVWIVLYTCMGVSSYLVYGAQVDAKAKRTALCFYGAQLLVNFFWSLLFFNLALYFVALAWLVLLWVLVAITVYKMYSVSKPAAFLLLPYLAWLTFAGYLNVGIALLN